MKGVKSIKGNTSPQIGADVSYEVDTLYPGTAITDYNQVKWKLYTKESNNTWRELRGTLKTGRKVSFSFPQKWLGKQLLVEAYLNAPEKKSPPGLIISPIQGERKITHLFLRDANNKAFATPPKYGENVKLNIHTQNLYNETVTVQVWERDTVSNTGHNSKENTLLDTFRIKVNNLDGKISQTITLNLAWRIKAQKGALEGGMHEYYLHASAPQTTAVISRQTTNVQDLATNEQTLTERVVSTVVNIVDGITKTPGTNSTLVGVGNQQLPENNGCGQRYCIDKSTPPNELIREINIRLSGFGGNVPTDTFTDRTERMIKQFQRDYMNVPETGKVCGNVLRAIDDLQAKYPIDFEELKCKCNTCSGFGDGSNKGQYIKGSSESHHKYEYPGIHRSLLSSLRSVKFYLEKDGRFSFNKVNSGYRCRFHDEYKKRPTTNHMGKALDLHFNNRSGRTRSTADMETIRMDIFNKYLGAKWDWKAGQTNIFNLESTAIGATTWVHYDVREFDAVYLRDNYFAKNSSALNGKSIVTLANELGFSNTCNCQEASASAPRNSTNTTDDRVDPRTLSTSEKGKEFIKSWENIHSKPYDDSEGYATIGIGYLIAKKSYLNLTRAEVERTDLTWDEFKNGLSAQRITELFLKRLGQTERAVQRDIRVNLYQYEFDALVSLLFNTGPEFLNVGGANKGETKIKKNINNKMYEEGADEFGDVTNGGTKGLVRRRNAEIKMFKTNVYENNK